jgi:hypothetical protein
MRPQVEPSRDRRHPALPRREEVRLIVRSGIEILLEPQERPVGENITGCWSPFFAFTTVASFVSQLMSFRSSERASEMLMPVAKSTSQSARVRKPCKFREVE